jgi:hypothetical protein
MALSFSNMVKGKPAGTVGPGGPSHLPCAGWEDRQTLTSFVQSSAYNLDLPLSDVMAITRMSEKSKPVDLAVTRKQVEVCGRPITVNFRLAN